MGYGFGGFLIAVGLVLALAVQDSISGVDTTMIGWILTGVGAVMLLATFATLNSSGRRKNEVVKTHRDGSQSVEEHNITT